MSKAKIAESSKGSYILDYLGEGRYTKVSDRDGILGEFEGPIQKADVVNGNKRRYGLGVWETCLKNQAVVERLGERAMVGELDHPDTGMSSYPRVSHVMTEVTLRPDGTIWGKADILDTPHGHIADSLFRAKVRVGISSRGDGSTHEAEDGVTEVENDYIPETWDLVVNPSTPGAFVSPRQQQESRVQIAKAIAALVERTQDTRVLVESHKIITELGANDSDLQRVAQACATKLKECMGASCACESTIPQPASTTKETPMGKTIGEQAPEVAALAESLAESRIKALRRKFSEDNRGLLVQIQEQAAQLNKAGRREKAAESIIDEFMFRARKLKEERDQAVAQLQQGGSTQAGGGNAKVAQLEKELAAAKGLLEAALQTIEKLKGFVTKAKTAEGVVAAFVEAMRGTKRAKHIESLTRGMGNAPQVRRILESLPSIRKINETFSTLQGMTSGGAVPFSREAREPLPHSSSSTAAGRQLVESIAARGGSNPTPSAARNGGSTQGLVTSRLVEKLGGR